MHLYAVEASLANNKNFNHPSAKMEAFFFFYFTSKQCAVSQLLLLSFKWFQSSIICEENCLRLKKKKKSISHPHSIGLGKGNKVMSNVSHAILHSIRQTLAHTNDIEINWCNDNNSCLGTVRGESPTLQFQALHLAWHVMWSQLSLKKTNPLSLCFT